jgi:hypothetical protein
MLSQIILTPWEARRLIAKAVVQLPQVKHALQEGIVCIARGTTTSYIIEELSGPIKKEEYCIGCIEPERLCLVPEKNRLPEIAYIRGAPQEIASKDIIKDMGSQDVFIKGANAVDPNFEAGILLGSPVGGTMGSVIGALYAKGIHFVIPVGLEKLVPFSVRKAKTFTGFTRVDSSMGMAVGLFPVLGTVVTEIQALEQMGVMAVPIAAGGCNGAEGASLLAIQGEEERMKNVLEIIDSIKGEPPLRLPTETCKTCNHATCPWKGRAR